jgi:aspartate/methionine/tyrosine aminotransferase
MGVIYVVAEAAKLGYYGEHPDWCNLGQGMPEVGALPNAPERVSEISILPDDHAYGPVAGLSELREAVAALYNRQFRQGMKSQYIAANVAITAGGRLALTRAVWALGQIDIPEARVELEKARDVETDPWVLEEIRLACTPQVGK